MAKLKNVRFEDEFRLIVNGPLMHLVMDDCRLSGGEKQVKIKNVDDKSPHVWIDWETEVILEN